MCGTVCRRNRFPIGPSMRRRQAVEPRIAPALWKRVNTHFRRLGTVVSTACRVALFRSKPWHPGNFGDLIL